MERQRNKMYILKTYASLVIHLSKKTQNIGLVGMSNPMGQWLSRYLNFDRQLYSLLFFHQNSTAEQKKKIFKLNILPPIPTLCFRSHGI